MNIVNGILIFCLGVVLTIGVLVFIGEHNQAQTSNVGQADIANTNTNTSSASEAASSNGIFQYCNGSFQVNPSDKNSLVVFLLYINNTGDKTYSIDQNNWNVEINGKTYNAYMSSDFKNSEKNTLYYVKPGNEASATFAYNVDGKVEVGSPIKLIYTGMNNTTDDVVSCTIQSLVDQSTDIGRLITTGIQGNTQVYTSTETSTPVTKTLADKESESNSDNSYASEDNSNSNIFDYCTWQADTAKKIGEYNEASENKSYVIVTLKINNTGDQTYSTNPNYWHLKIGEMYYQPDTATYDSSLNHMTTDVGPGGKITTKIAYLVDGEPSISDMDMYYDGPGSDGTIHS
jgi:archaellum component FlaG (FlaF/FlaG flagellin family)